MENQAKERRGNSIMNITVPYELFDKLVDDAIDLQSEWQHKKDDPRCGYGDQFVRSSP